jgi:hypothetical protein
MDISEISGNEEVFGIFRHKDSRGYYVSVWIKTSKGEIVKAEGASFKTAYEIAKHEREKIERSYEVQNERQPSLLRDL